MKRLSVTLILVLVSITFFSISCKKRNQKIETLKELYKIYSNGKIDECDYNGKTVFSAGMNFYDAGSTVYDLDGNIIGSCNAAWGGVDAICNQLSGCKTVYCVKDNIWGKAAVNNFNLK